MTIWLYSAGNKRKLSAAVALIGDPPVIILDEPTRSMGPVARQQLWKALTEARSKGQTILMSSHRYNFHR